MASDTCTITELKREQHLIISLHGIILLCLIFFLISTCGETGTSSRLSKEYYVPYLREVAITLPIFATVSFAFSAAIITKAAYYFSLKPPNPKKQMKWLAIAGVGQLILAGLLTTLTALQATFLPHPLGQCKNLSQLGKPSYLDAIAEATTPFDGRKDSRHGVCSRMVHNWRSQIANIILMGIVGLLCLHLATKYRHSEAQAHIRFENRVKERGIGVPAPNIDAVQDVDVEIGLAPLARQLSHTRDEDLTGTSETQIYSISLSAPLPRRPLQLVLGAYGLLSTIAAECHYHDIWNLMLVSRGIRTVILDTATQKNLWKKSLCSQPRNQHPQNQFYPSNPPTGKLIRCFSCGSPMCKTCETTGVQLQAETIRHLRDCRPCCGECFRGKYCFLSRGPKTGVNPETMLPGKCDCKPEPQPTGIDDYAVSAPCVVASVDVCKVCEGKTDTEMLSMRAGGGRMRATTGAGGTPPNLYRVEGFKCHHCQRDFRRGEAVWWACTRCGEECLGGFHSQMGEMVAR